jgi:DNA mismatch repair ATPase MutS
MELIKELFDRNKDEKNYIDDGTYNDLNLDTFFEKLDFTSTTPGEQVLYMTLRQPLYNKNSLRNRENIYEYFKEHYLKREEINRILKKINSNRHSVSNIIDKPLENFKRLRFKYNCGLAFFTFCLILFATVPSTTTILLYIASMIINIYLHFSGEREFVGQVDTVIYLGKIINSCDKIVNYTKDSPFDPSNRLSFLSKELSHIGKRITAMFMIRSIPVVGEMISIMFLVKEKSFFRICDEVVKYSDEVMELYELVGSLDSCLSVIDYRDTLQEFSRPVFTNERSSYDVVDIKHPILVNPIGNDFVKKSNGVVITGSNMSGKSTFLRTIAVNAIMAQTINTTLSRKYKTSFFKVISSISVRDDIQTGKSFYRSEAEAIKRVIEEADGNVTVLSLIDEIFKGTNPVERINAACEILSYIVKRNVFSIVTTHDINLLPLIDSYDTYYFSETIQNSKLKFDYKIKDGVSPSGNATKILEIMGYPSAIIANIYRRIDEIS